MRPVGTVRLAGVQRELLWHGLALLTLALVCAPGLWLDPRTLNDINVWIKPIKFQLSSGLYLLTLCAFFLVALPPGADRTRRGRYVVWAAIATSWFEVVYITLQAARGESSHWNLSSTFTTVMYGLMGLGALVLASTGFVQGLMIRSDRTVPLEPALRHAIFLGLTMSFVLGAGFGAVMGAGTSHWVGGVASDAGGLPLFEWSRQGGDLRVAHFFGLHAMQLVPAFGWWATRRLPRAWQRPSIDAFAAVLAIFTLGTFVQAKLGVPFVPA
jgi:hypothetical protein